MSEFDPSQAIDPWGFPVVPGVMYVACDFIAPNNLPCTSNAKQHPSAHYTSDGRNWPLANAPAEDNQPTTDAQQGERA